MSDTWIARTWRSLQTRLEGMVTSLVIILLCFILVGLYFYPTMLIFIYPGESGVLWKRFDRGTVTGWHEPFVSEIDADAKGSPRDPEGDNHYPFREGFHLIFPWDKMYIYDIRLQQRHQTLNVLSVDGLQMEVGITVRWKLIEADLGKLHKLIGPDYAEKILIPTVASYSRAHLAETSPGGIYSFDRLKMQDKILHSVQHDLQSRYFPDGREESFIIVEDILIRDVRLPDIVQKAIEDKQRQRHLAEAHIYRLVREQIESERKQVEGEGINRFQSAIANGIDERYLRWRGIDATLELATSDNAKVVVVGSGKDGLPLILGGIDSPSPSDSEPASSNQ